MLNLFALSVLCFAVAFVWDVAYASLYDHGPSAILSVIPGPLWLLVFPMLLCAEVGQRTGQWRTGRRGFIVAGAAAWCIAVPFVVLIPFLSFMCFAFKSCFGD